jgi:hypothetical protein
MVCVVSSYICFATSDPQWQARDGMDVQNTSYCNLFYADVTFLMNLFSHIANHCCNQRHNNEVEQEQNQACSLSVSTGEEDSDPVEASSGATKGNASVMQTALNVAKTCMGTGTLALPYAASQGGYICSTLGFILMALWNLYCVDRMLQCNHLLHTINRLQQVRKLPRRTQSTSDDDDDESSSVDISNFIPSRTSTFGKVIWTAIGSVGLACYEIIMIVLLLGIIIAYEGESFNVFLFMVNLFHPSVFCPPPPFSLELLHIQLYIFFP